MDGVFSECSNIAPSVPQGSVLGTILFMLYTADLMYSVESELYSNADDTTLVAACHGEQRSIVY